MICYNMMCYTILIYDNCNIIVWYNVLYYAILWYDKLGPSQAEPRADPWIGLNHISLLFRYSDLNNRDIWFNRTINISYNKVPGGAQSGPLLEAMLLGAAPDHYDDWAEGALRGSFLGHGRRIQAVISSQRGASGGFRRLPEASREVFVHRLCEVYREIPAVLPYW